MLEMKEGSAIRYDPKPPRAAAVKSRARRNACLLVPCHFIRHYHGHDRRVVTRLSSSIMLQNLQFHPQFACRTSLRREGASVQGECTTRQNSGDWCEPTSSRKCAEAADALHAKAKERFCALYDKLYREASWAMQLPSAAAPTFLRWPSRGRIHLFGGTKRCGPQ
jgi:hypothetical protein